MQRMNFSAPNFAVKSGALLAALLVLGACSPRAERIPAEQLQIRINLLCTTCDDFLRCSASPESEEFVLYRLREKSFWAQIATIWDYLIQSVRPKTADSRPLTIYAQSTLDGSTTRRVLLDESRTRADMAKVDMVTGLITLPDSLIDMRNGEWRDPQGEILGSCSTMSRREGYAWIRALLGRER